MRVLAPFHRWLKRRDVPTKLRVIDGGGSNRNILQDAERRFARDLTTAEGVILGLEDAGAGRVTLVRAGTFDDLDRCPFEEAFGDVASIPHEGRVNDKDIKAHR